MDTRKHRRNRCFHLLYIHCVGSDDPKIPPTRIRGKPLTSQENTGEILFHKSCS
jgi:hypothetical protein